MRSKSVGGVLQAILEVRDGNNENNFRGTASSVTTQDGITRIKIKDTNCNDVFKLNIPESQGRITIGNVEYEYDSFEVRVGDDGQYEYEFALKGTLSEPQKENLQYACDNSKSAKIGESVAYKGIPYYMSRLNEF